VRIRQYPDPVLFKVCKRVTTFDSNLVRFVNDMFKVMRDNNGVGLAAPQVGVSRQIIVTSCPGEDPLYMINPVVIYSASPAIGTEGCLSIDNGKTFYEISRDSYVKVKYQDVKGKFFTYETKTAGDLLTRCILHEIEHTKGESSLWRMT
jgi:peptide deformylase